MSFEDAMVVRGKYGEQESNPITPELKQFREEIEETVDLTDRRLHKIIRLRLVTDPGFPFYDVSYCYGVLKDGTRVRVDLPVYQFSRRNLAGQLIEMCREAHVFAKGLGLLDPETISVLR